MRRQASLQGRLLRVLLLAVGLVAGLLVAMDYLAFQSGIADRVAQRSAAEGLGEALADVDEPVAAAIVRATELQFNRSRRAAGLPDIEDLAFELQTIEGRQVYASGALKGQGALAPEQARQEVIHMRGHAYWPYLHETARWRVILYEPVVQDSLLLRWLGGGLLPSILVAVPLLMLPLWWAVRTGLAPLRRLVSALAKRDAAALMPLEVDLRYAELQPIVRAIDDLLARARQHVAQERALTNNTAHELRTPLAVIATHAHALATAPDAASADVARQGIQRGVQRTSHLVEQLLTLARLESSGVPRATESVDLVAVCRQHLIDLTPLADARGIEMALVSPDQCQATVVLPAVHSVVDNLLRNALSHCPPGSHVEVQLLRQDGQVRVVVLDDGPGMPAEERAQAFERFFRGQGAGPGSGLGLAIVGEAARLLGGRVFLEAQEGAGLRVTVEWRDGAAVA
ncbi:sensor histidine kinase [Paracidovorax anthurii]|uniref:histidine kinase n=1 Tax=Paracidovorax anthurii TaxID=78229 RepID=A0A328Z2A0_9BURK|nr:ATP-binding protein [Paracidovorax anthurii]RAR78642.1 two-component system sensor histidine kinase QseC [Paracidovorax anthurii]